MVGIAGTDEKCSWVRDELGFDAAINYRSEDIKSALARHCPRGIDVYFDNFGGPILDAVLEKVNLRARIALCGMISDYTREQGMGITNLRHLIFKRAQAGQVRCAVYRRRRPEGTPLYRAVQGHFET